MLKLSSCGKINPSNNKFGTLDQIISNDNDY